MLLGDYVPPNFSGVISIKQGENILHEEAYGFADAANRRFNRLDTKFVTASAGKAFTAAAILGLIEKGQLSLDSTLGELLDFDIYSSTAKGMGDGGAFTTAADLESFWRGLYGGKLVSSEMLAEMTKPQTAARCYGYGLWMEELEGRFIPHFEGCEPGIGCFSAYDIQRDLLITLITNRGDNIWKLSRDLMRHFYNNAPEWFDYGE